MYDGDSLSTEQAIMSEYCTGYVSGIADETTLRCPNDVTYSQIVRIVAKYLNDHPERLHERKFVLVEDAMRQVCK